MTGDLPCNKECHTRWCRYNDCGHCQDNDTCENRTTEKEDNQ